MTVMHGGIGMIPQWTRGDRLRKARQMTGLTTREFAERIGVAQKTVTDAENDKRESVRKILLNAWSLSTGVPVEWLETGTAPRPEPEGGGEAGGDEYAIRDSNPEPAGSEDWAPDLRILRVAA